MSSSSENANKLVRGLMIALFILFAGYALIYGLLDQSGDSNDPKPTPSASTTK